MFVAPETKVRLQNVRMIVHREGIGRGGFHSWFKLNDTHVIKIMISWSERNGRKCKRK